jgi:hypothetical protein
MLDMGIYESKYSLTVELSNHKHKNLIDHSLQLMMS